MRKAQTFRHNWKPDEREDAYDPTWQCADCGVRADDMNEARVAESVGCDKTTTPESRGGSRRAR